VRFVIYNVINLQLNLILLQRNNDQIMIKNVVITQCFANMFRFTLLFIYFTWNIFI